MSIDSIARGLAVSAANIVGGFITGATAWSIGVRNVITTFPAAVIRPNTPSTNMAFDVMPNGAPGNSGDAPLSVAWIDVCNADTFVGASAVATCRMGCGTSYAEIGSYNFGSTQLPLIFTMSGTIVGEWSILGNFDFISQISNGLSYVHITNTSSGSTAYTEIGAQYSFSAGYGVVLRVYGPGWTAVAGDQSYGELTSGANLAGLNITSQATTGPIRIIAGGYTPGGPGSGQQVAQFNASGASNAPGSLALYYPPVLPIYAIGSTLPTGTAALTGARAFVSNGLLATGWGNAVAGTGSVLLPVFCIGTGGWHYG